MLGRAVILLVIALGFLVAPMESMACDKPSEVEKSCCAKHHEDHIPSETESATEIGGEEHICDHSNEDGDQTSNCSGYCQQSSCHCVTFHLTQVIVPRQLHAEYQFFFYKKEGKFTYLEVDTSSGFNTIWQPPKIG